MVSRPDKIKQAGTLMGLAAAHFALFGQSFREGITYELQAMNIVLGKRLNDLEKDALIAAALITRD
ncbi:MAG: hypothetical protein H0Z39_11260 [Peptococcaceae bacterium]|nr:hypothetical protein [Peptococcaceae bacterium]